MSGKKLLILVPFLFLCCICSVPVFLLLAGQGLFTLPDSSVTQTPVTSPTQFPTFTPWPTTTPFPTTTAWPSPTSFNEASELDIMATGTPSAYLYIPVVQCDDNCGTAQQDFTTLSEAQQKDAVLTALKNDGQTAVGIGSITIERVGQRIIVYRIDNQGFYLDPVGGIHVNDSMDLLIFGLRLEQRAPSAHDGVAVMVNDQIVLLVVGGEPCSDAVVTAKDGGQVYAVVLADNLSVEQTVGKLGLVTNRPVVTCSLP